MRFRPDSARKLSANLYDIYHFCVYSEKLLMMDTGILRNMWSGSIPILLASCHQNSTTYTIAVCTVKNS